MEETEKFLSTSLCTPRKSYRRHSIHNMSPIIAIVFVSCLFGLYGIIYLIDGILPKPLNISDEKDNPHRFIAERAKTDLKLLTDIGPRVVGSSENEILAVEFLIQKIAKILEQAHSSQHIELDIQTFSGSYYLEPPYNGINAYGEVQNIMVKLHSKNNSAHSLLVNAHFDSVAFSPGGSDDGIMCVIMLEILYKLSQLQEPPEHNVIFLFNGAEETPLHAAHGFIAHHKWAKETQVVVNLDAAGAGGKEILFQAGPGQPWLLKYYQKVPYPNGQAAGEELFQLGFIPSGTDFKIFRSIGNMIGLDMAFTRNGYRYHTRYDDFTNIPLGSYQHAGDNVLSLVTNLANSPELANPKEQPPQGFIFYDFYGLFMIVYSKTFAIILNVIVSGLSCIVALKIFYDFGLRLNLSSLQYVSFTMGALLLGWISALFFVILIALIIDWLKFSLSWYGSPWIILGLYVLPTFNLCCCSIVLFNCYYEKKSISISAQTQIQTHSIRLIWTAPLFIGTLLGIRSVYGILIPVLFHAISGVIIQIFSWQHSVRKWQIVYILGSLIPTLFLMKAAIEVFALFLPICGRIGSDRNPEIYIGVLAVGMTILISSFYTPIITLINKPRLVLIFFQGVSLLFLIFIFTPLGFPYNNKPTSPTPQRFWIYHLRKDFRNESNQITKSDFGYFLLNLDRNSPNSVKKYVDDLRNIQTVIREDCENYLLCGFPISTPRMIPILHESTWIPAEPPIIEDPVGLNLNSRATIGSLNLQQFNFTASGPSQFFIYISPRHQIKLNGTNLVTTLSSQPILWNERPIYIINYVWGKRKTSFNFTLDFEVPSNWSKPIFDIALAGSYKHERLNVKTPNFAKFLSQFPPWTDITAWLGLYQSWVY